MPRRHLIALAIVAATTVAIAAPASASELTYEIQALHSGKCLAVGSGWERPEARIEQRTCTGSALQRWHLTVQPDGTHKITSVATGLCLDVWSASTANQVPLQQWWCNSQPNQRFQLRWIAHRRYEIRPSHAPDKCLDIAFASSSEGARVQQHTCVRQTNELFTIVSS
jgi:hypothetical protein